MSGAARSRADVGPSTWEIPAAFGLTWLVAAALILPGGRGAAGALFGGGWVWPQGSHALVAAVGGLFTGDVAAGLVVGDAALLPSAAVVYAVIAAGQLLLVAGTVWAGLWWRRTFGSGSRTGMADRGEVEAVLGVSRLRAARSLIRPGLYPAGRTARPEPLAEGAL